MLLSYKVAEVYDVHFKNSYYVHSRSIKVETERKNVFPLVNSPKSLQGDRTNARSWDSIHFSPCCVAGTKLLELLLLSPKVWVSRKLKLLTAWPNTSSKFLLIQT